MEIQWLNRRNRVAVHHKVGTNLREVEDGTRWRNDVTLSEFVVPGDPLVKGLCTEGGVYGQHVTHRVD